MTKKILSPPPVFPSWSALCACRPAGLSVSLLCYAANIAFLSISPRVYPVYFQAFNVVCTAFGKFILYSEKYRPEREKYLSERERKILRNVENTYLYMAWKDIPHASKRISSRMENFPRKIFIFLREKNKNLRKKKYFLTIKNYFSHGRKLFFLRQKIFFSRQKKTLVHGKHSGASRLPFA